MLDFNNLISERSFKMQIISELLKFIGRKIQIIPPQGYTTNSE